MKTPAKVENPEELEFHPRFEYGDQAKVAVVCGADDGTKLGAGYVRLENAEIPWTIRYDEVILVLEGEITIRTDNGDLTAVSGETIWLPADTALTYVAKSALVFYAIQPSDWNAR
ncbi:MAG: ethanolamine utilization protein EutQ [Pseudomonadota bacterium]